MSEEELPTIKGIRIDPKVLRAEPIERCRLSECRAACCTGGVWVESSHVARILEAAEAIKPFLPPDRSDEATWFSPGEAEENWPLGYEQGTTTLDDPARPGQTCCVFLRPDRKCALQAASQAHGFGYPGLKPYFCAIYPLYHEHGVLTVDDETPLDFEGGGCQRPSAQVQRVFEVYRDEAILILGEDGYHELGELSNLRPAPEHE